MTQEPGQGIKRGLKVRTEQVGELGLCTLAKLILDKPLRSDYCKVGVCRFSLILPEDQPIQIRTKR